MTPVTARTQPLHRRGPGPCHPHYGYIPLVVAGLLYAAYLAECWHCHTRRQLLTKVPTDAIHEQVRRMQQALPLVWWKVVCYHYARRTRQITRYRNGDPFTSSQVYYERLDTHSAKSAFNFLSVGQRDTSKLLVDLDCFAATKIRFTRSYSFQNNEAKAEYDRQRSQFYQENASRDEYMDTEEGVELMNCSAPDYLIAMAKTKQPPLFLRYKVFAALSLCLLSWPLRVLIEYQTAFLHYDIHKVFGETFAFETGLDVMTLGLLSNGELQNDQADEDTVARSSGTDGDLPPSYSDIVLSSRQLRPGSGLLTRYFDLPVEHEQTSLSRSRDNDIDDRSLSHRGAVLQNPHANCTCSQNQLQCGAPPSYEDCLFFKCSNYGSITRSHSSSFFKAFAQRLKNITRSRTEYESMELLECRVLKNPYT